jgi:hypothetical protein
MKIKQLSIVRLLKEYLLRDFEFEELLNMPLAKKKDTVLTN